MKKSKSPSAEPKTTPRKGHGKLQTGASSPQKKGSYGNCEGITSNKGVGGGKY